MTDTKENFKTDLENKNILNIQMDSPAISKGNMDRFKTWNNLIFDGQKSLDNLDWINEWHDNIANWILNHYKNKASRNGHYSSLAVYFRDVKPNKKLQDKYGDRAKVESQEYVKVAEKNKQLPDRPYITHDQIIAIRDRLKLNEFDSFDDNQKYLIFALYTMIYPLRKEWSDVEILKGYKGTNPDKNYIIVDEFKNKKTNYELHLASGKKKHDEIVIPLTKNLSKSIWQSVQKYPRKYILSKKTDMNEPLGKDGLGLILGLFSLGVDQLRSARATYELTKPDITTERKKNMAKLMRSSVEMLETYYKKVMKAEPEPVEIDEDKKQADRKERNRLAGIKYRNKQDPEEVARKKREQRARAKLAKLQSV